MSNNAYSNLDYVFYNCESLDAPKMNFQNVSNNVSSMDYMFYGAGVEGTTTLDNQKMKFSKLVSCKNAFTNAKFGFKNSYFQFYGDSSNDTNKPYVSSIAGLFSGNKWLAEKAPTIILSKNPSSIDEIQEQLYKNEDSSDYIPVSSAICGGGTEYEIYKNGKCGIIDFSNLYSNTSIKEVDLRGISCCMTEDNVSSSTYHGKIDYTSMFENCGNLTTVNGFIPPYGYTYERLFNNCSSLEIDISKSFLNYVTSKTGHTDAIVLSAQYAQRFWWWYGGWCWDNYWWRTYHNNYYNTYYNGWYNGYYYNYYRYYNNWYGGWYGYPAYYNAWYGYSPFYNGWYGWGNWWRGGWYRSNNYDKRLIDIKNNEKELVGRKSVNNVYYRCKLIVGKDQEITKAIYKSLSNTNIQRVWVYCNDSDRSGWGVDNTEKLNGFNSLTCKNTWFNNIDTLMFKIDEEFELSFYWKAKVPFKNGIIYMTDDIVDYPYSITVTTSYNNCKIDLTDYIGQTIMSDIKYQPTLYRLSNDDKDNLIFKGTSNGTQPISITTEDIDILKSYGIYQFSLKTDVNSNQTTSFNLNNKNDILKLTTEGNKFIPYSNFYSRKIVTLVNKNSELTSAIAKTIATYNTNVYIDKQLKTTPMINGQQIVSITLKDGERYRIKSRKIIASREYADTWENVKYVSTYTSNSNNDVSHIVRIFTQDNIYGANRYNTREWCFSNISLKLANGKIIEPRNFVENIQDNIVDVDDNWRTIVGKWLVEDVVKGNTESISASSKVNEIQWNTILKYRNKIIDAKIIINDDVDEYLEGAILSEAVTYGVNRTLGENGYEITEEDITTLKNNNITSVNVYNEDIIYATLANDVIDVDKNKIFKTGRRISPADILILKNKKIDSIKIYNENRLIDDIPYPNEILNDSKQGMKYKITLAKNTSLTWNNGLYKFNGKVLITPLYVYNDYKTITINNETDLNSELYGTYFAKEYTINGNTYSKYTFIDDNQITDISSDKNITSIDVYEKELVFDAGERMTYRMCQAILNKTICEEIAASTIYIAKGTKFYESNGTLKKKFENNTKSTVTFGDNRENVRNQILNAHLVEAVSVNNKTYSKNTYITDAIATSIINDTTIKSISIYDSYSFPIDIRVGNVLVESSDATQQTLTMWQLNLMRRNGIRSIKISDYSDMPNDNHLGEYLLCEESSDTYDVGRFENSYYETSTLKGYEPSSIAYMFNNVKKLYSTNDKFDLAVLVKKTKETLTANSIVPARKHFEYAFPLMVIAMDSAPSELGTVIYDISEISKNKRIMRYCSFANATDNALYGLNSTYMKWVFPNGFVRYGGVLQSNSNYYVLVPYYPVLNSSGEITEFSPFYSTKETNLYPPGWRSLFNVSAHYRYHDEWEAGRRNPWNVLYSDCSECSKHRATNWINKSSKLLAVLVYNKKDDSFVGKRYVGTWSEGIHSFAYHPACDGEYSTSSSRTYPITIFDGKITVPIPDVGSKIYADGSVDSRNAVSEDWYNKFSF